MINTNNISYQYEGGTSFKFPNIVLEKGEQALLLGESGCGKTTLLHLLSGLLSPISGSIEIAGTDITQLSGRRLDRFRGQHIGLIFQTPHFIQSLSVKENLLLSQSLAKKQKDERLIKNTLVELGILSKVDSKLKNLSQGEKQRVSIARTLINRPNVILADEPTSALDDKNCNAVVKLLQAQASKYGATLLVVTHDTRLTNLFENQIKLS